MIKVGCTKLERNVDLCDLGNECNTNNGAGKNKTRQATTEVGKGRQWAMAVGQWQN